MLGSGRVGSSVVGASHGRVVDSVRQLTPLTDSAAAGLTSAVTPTAAVAVTRVEAASAAIDRRLVKERSGFTGGGLTGRATYGGRSGRRR
jgi:hypothetical protein